MCTDRSRSADNLLSCLKTSPGDKIHAQNRYPVSKCALVGIRAERQQHPCIRVQQGKLDTLTILVIQRMIRPGMGSVGKLPWGRNNQLDTGYHPNLSVHQRMTHQCMLRLVSKLGDRRRLVHDWGRSGLDHKMRTKKYSTIHQHLNTCPSDMESRMKHPDSKHALECMLQPSVVQTYTCYWSGRSVLMTQQRTIAPDNIRKLAA